MDLSTQRSIIYGILLSVSFAIVGFFLSLLPSLAKNDWILTGLEIQEYSFISPVIILAIAVATGIIIVLINNIVLNVERLPEAIEDVTVEAVNTLKSDIDDFKRELSSGIVNHEEYTYRALIYHKDQGIILNGFSDDVSSSRNILFSNKTINLIFREIRGVNLDVLKRIGYKSSDRFADELVASIRRKGASNDLFDWIKHWIGFDSDAGFGKFEIGSQTPEEWKNNLTIILKHSFLTTDSEIGHHKVEQKICDFITGYIQGIIDHFPEPVLSRYNLKTGEISVDHDINNSNECISAGRDPSEGCIFYIKAK